MMDGGLHIGEVLGARYRIDELIGQGGMGVVARATDLSTRSLVAVKALRPEVRGHREVLERFNSGLISAAKTANAWIVTGCKELNNSDF